MHYSYSASNCKFNTSYTFLDPYLTFKLVMFFFNILNVIDVPTGRADSPDSND